MIKHIWSILCEDSSVDQETNKISIRNVAEVIEIRTQGDLPKEAVIPVNLEIVSFFTRANSSHEEEIQLRGKLINPEMDEMGGGIRVSIKFPAKSNRLRSRLKIQGLPIKGEGIYVYIISLKTSQEKDFSVVAELPLEIKILK